MRMTRRRLRRLIREELENLKELEVLGHDVSIAPPPDDGQIDFDGTKWEVATMGIELSVDMIEKVGEAIKVKISAFSDNKWLRQDREALIEDPAKQQDLITKLTSNTPFTLEVKDPDEETFSIDFTPV